MIEQLRARPWPTPAMRAVRADAAVLGHARRVEAVLAGAQAAEGLIDADTAAAIPAACEQLVLDPAALAEDAAFAGTLPISLLRQLRESLPAPAAAAVHRAATGQDLPETTTLDRRSRSPSSI